MTTGGDQTGTELLRDGRIVGPWTCLRCRYRIEHLLPTDPCPECGGSLAESLDPRLLRFAPPATIDRVRRGARGLELCVLAAVLSAPAIGIYFATVDAMESRGLSLELSYFLNGPLFPLVLVLAVMVMVARSVFKYTTPLPASCEPTRATTQLRRLLRVFAVAVPGLFLPLAVVVAVEWLWTLNLHTLVPVWIPALGASAMFAIAVALVFGLSLYAWSIGDRTWAYGKPLRSFAVAPALFALLSGTLALPAALLSDSIAAIMETSVWGVLQWAFFSLWLAWMLFAGFALFFSLVVVDAVRSAAKRDFREASAAHREQAS